MKHHWMYKASRQGSTLPYHNSKRGPTLYCSRVLGYRKPQSPLYWSGEQEATPVQISKRPKTADRELESRRIGSPPRHEWVRATPLDPRRPKPEGEDSLHGDRRSFQTRTITGPQSQYEIKMLSNGSYQANGMQSKTPATPTKGNTSIQTHKSPYK